MWATNKTQQIPFIDLFKSALHVLGDKFAHPQEHFLTVYTAFGTMHCNDKLQLKVFWHVSSHVKILFYHYSALYKELYIQSNCSWGWASLLPETCRADLRRSINGICCILLAAHIVALMTHCLTNIKTSVQYYMWCMRKTAWENTRNWCGCASLTDIVYCSLQLHLPSNVNIFTILYEVRTGALMKTDIFWNVPSSQLVNI